MTALRTVLWPISVAKLTAPGLSRSADSAAPTSSAELPQLPATMVVTPMRTKLAAAGRSTRLSACVWTSMNPGDTTRPDASITCAACDRGIRPIAAIRPSLIADVRELPAPAGAVDDRAAGDHEIVAGGLPRLGHRACGKHERERDRDARQQPAHGPAV